ncbi:hypothetical protein, partial [Kitasatospora sp. MBT66]|uniref:hypothetical protein n=1 Tax=Kitasatospora sp. MBT66 TaxID=1444769 RepID=UPI001A7E0641
VFPAYQIFAAGLTGFRFSEFPLGGFPSLRSEAYQSFRCAQFRDLPRRRGRAFEKHTHLDSAMS